jgi:hypothetical protein
MLCDLPTVQQAAVGDCLSFDPFPFDQNGLAPLEDRRPIGIDDRPVAGVGVCHRLGITSGAHPDSGNEFNNVVICSTPPA